MDVINQPFTDPATVHLNFVLKCVFHRSVSQIKKSENSTQCHDNGAYIITIIFSNDVYDYSLKYIYMLM